MRKAHLIQKDNLPKILDEDLKNDYLSLTW